MPRFLIALLASTALMALGSVPPALAQGGAGGAGLGGAGGANSDFSTGGSGGDDAVNGGGGGGAGDTGGRGGAGDSAGGAGGAAPGASGSAGVAGVNAGSGGGGGAHGIVDSVLPTTARTGGAGGAGGAATGAGGGGGGGGAGGAGLVYTALGNAGTLFDAITGGAGGAGGAAPQGRPGQGGAGGAGIVFTSPDNVTISIQANVSGGAGGAGGGEGGVGIRGGGLSITLGANLSGGLGGDGVTRANALELTGGTNLLAFGAGAAVTGGIALNGFASLELVHTDGTELTGPISGSGSINMNGTGTLRLSGANSYSGGTTLTAGNLALAHAQALGSGTVVFRNDGLGSNPTLTGEVTATLANDLRVEAGGNMRIAAATGTTLTLTGNLMPASGSGLIFGAAGRDGVIHANFSAVDTTDAPFSSLQIVSGRVVAGNSNFNDITANSQFVSITSGATLDLNGHLITIRSLYGEGTLTNTNLTRIGDGSFGGDITGIGGSLEKVGPGTLTLTGTNTYTGTTEISGGTLRIGNGGTTGTLGTGDVINNGALVFHRSNALTVGNVISGSGSVTQAGSGVLTLTSANSYTGGTAITGGTIALGHIGALGSGAVSISDGALVSNVTGSLANAIGVPDGATATIGAASGQTFTLTGALSMRPGSTLTIGSATQTGTVVANFASADFFSPATLALRIAGGTLQVGNLILNQLTQSAASVTIAAGATLDYGGFIGTIGNLQGGGTLTSSAVTQIGAGNFSGVISGTGGFDKVGAGTLMLTGANTYSGTTTISGGTLVIGQGGQLSGGSVTNNAALVFARNDTVTVGNAISGSGSLTQAGTGTLILTGANTYAGLTRINAGGTLQIGDGGTSGQIGGGAVLNNGALVVNRGDAVTLANAISGSGSLTQAGAGTLTVTGASSYSGGTTINAGSTLRVEAAGTLGTGGLVNQGTVVFSRAGEVTVGGGVTGAGSLTQAGSGTLTIVGSYAQTTTTISSGTLRFSGGGGTFAAGTVINDGVLIFNRSDSVQLWSISGTGRVEIGSGTVTLAPSSNWTYTGGTFIAAGATLQVGDFHQGGTLPGDVVNNGTLQFGAGGPAVIGVVANTISGSGRVILASQGIIVTGNNSYSGGTILWATADVTVGNGGTVGTLGTGSIDMQVANLSFNRSDTVVVANAISGQGRLRHIGSGTLVLTGANTYGGSTQVTQGVLQVGDGGTSGSLGTSAVAISTGATLVLNRAGTLMIEGAMSGAGTLRQIGPGTTALTGANSMSGTVRIESGTLQVGAGGTSGGLGSGDVLNNATLAFNRSDRLVVANTISGGGVLRQIGTGTTTLTSANTYSGGTVITGGAISVSSDGNLGASPGVLVFDGGTLVTSQSFNTARSVRLESGGGSFAPDSGTALVLDTAISGPGGLGMTGAGTLLLNGANTYTGPTNVNSGTMILGATGRLSSGALTVATGAFLDLSRMTAPSLSVASLAGGGTVSIGGNQIARNLTITQGGTVFSGSLIDGGAGGSLTIAGGTTTLTGNSTYTGATTINGGMLVVNGTLSGTSGVVVNGGTLGGSGTLPNLVVASGGSIAPGNSIGTITINGSLTLAAGSTTVIELQGREADLIIVAGSAAVGGTLRVVPLGGPYGFNTRYTLIRANVITGQFAAVTTGGAFGAGVTTRVTNMADALELVLLPAPLVHGSNGNQKAVARSLDAVAAAGVDVTGLFALYNLPASGQARGLGLLSGEVHASGARAAIETSGQFLNLMLDPWRSEGEGVGNIRVWASGFGGGGRRGGDASAGSSAVTGGGGGIAAGAEVRLAAGITAGFALAGAGTQTNLGNGLGRAESNQVQGAVYARAQHGALRLGAALALGAADVTTRRQVAYLGPGNLQGRYTSNGVALRLEAGWAWEAPMGVTLTPGIAFQGGWFDTPSFTERASGALAPGALSVSSRPSQSRIELGLRADVAVAARVSAFGRVAWAGYLQRDATVNARFAGLPGSGFRVVGARPDANAALLSAGLDWRMSEAWSLTARLDGEVSANTALIGGTARLRYAF